MVEQFQPSSKQYPQIDQMGVFFTTAKHFHEIIPILVYAEILLHCQLDNGLEEWHFQLPTTAFIYDH